MQRRLLLITAIGLGLGQGWLPAFADTVDTRHADTDASDDASPADTAVQEVSDDELGGMRGRYTIGDNSVAWFGVTMISDWQTSGGQDLKAQLQLEMNFTGTTPKITFVPTVVITAANAPLPTTSGTYDGAGLANVGGMVQAVQVAGDGNRANNAASLSIIDGTPPPTGGGTPGNVATASMGGASATASVINGVAQVQLDINGAGQARQWIQSGGIGQSIQLSANNQFVSNSLQITLIRQTLANIPVTQAVAQAIALNRSLNH